MKLLPALVALLAATSGAAAGDTVFRMQLPVPLLMGSPEAEPVELPLAASPSSLILRGRIGAAMEGTVAATGGTMPYSWTMGPNAPTWLRAEDGRLHGTALSTGLWNTSVSLDDANLETGAIDLPVSVEVRDALISGQAGTSHKLQHGKATTATRGITGNIGKLSWSFSGDLPAGSYTASVHPSSPSVGVLTVDGSVPRGQYSGRLTATDQWDGKQVTTGLLAIEVGDYADQKLPDRTSHPPLDNTYRSGTNVPHLVTLNTGQALVYEWDIPVLASNCWLGRSTGDENSVRFRVDVRLADGSWVNGSVGAFTAYNNWLLTSDNCWNSAMKTTAQGGTKVTGVRLHVTAGSLPLRGFRVGLGSFVQ